MYVWFAVLDRFGDCIAREIPELDEMGSPFHGVYTTTFLVEWCAGCAILAFDNTPNGARCITTLAGAHGAAHFRICRQSTGAAGVQDDFIGVVHVDTLDNIDFTVLRPTRSNGPECRPCTANTPGHVLDVHHVQTLVVKLLAFDSHRIPTLAVRVQRSL